MSDLFLIAHKVRGEPAFDVAKQMICPICNNEPVYIQAEEDQWEDGLCRECEGDGYWWIIPTSGHRAYPFHYWPWDELACDSRVNSSVFDPAPLQFPDMPEGLPDHYPTRHSSFPSLDISTLLAPAVKMKIERRF